MAVVPIKVFDTMSLNEKRYDFVAGALDRAETDLVAIGDVLEQMRGVTNPAAADAIEERLNSLKDKYADFHRALLAAAKACNDPGVQARGDGSGK